MIISAFTTLDTVILSLNKRTNKSKVVKIKYNNEVSHILQNLNIYIKEIEYQIQHDMIATSEIILAMLKIERGTFDCKIHSEAKSPEIQQLIKAQNRMSDHFNHVTSQILKTLEKFSQNDYTSRIENDEVLGDFKVMVEQINDLGDKLRVAAKNDKENGELLSKEVEKLGNSSTFLTQSAEKEVQSLQTSTEDLETMTRDISGIVEQSMQVANHSEDIKTVVDTIKDIAEQTNLLALNAAIEAARAGDHGRGFAVVADEVRNLADKTQKSLSEINITINTLTQSTQDISSSIERQSEQSESINQNITELNTATEENAKMVEEINSASVLLTELSDRLVQSTLDKKF